MLDLQWLRKWIAEHHLQPDTIAEYRQSYRSNPARFLVVRDIFRPEVADKVSVFLARDARFEKIFGLYSKKLPYGEVSENEWWAASENDRFYRFGRLSGLPAESQIYSVPLIALDLRQRLNCTVSPEMIMFIEFYLAINSSKMGAWFATIAGHSTGTSQITNVNELRTGDYMGLHKDNFIGRKLSVVSYLAQDWRQEFGGALYVGEDDGTLHRVEAMFNSLVMFDVEHGREHYVEPVTSLAGARGRISVSGLTLTAPVWPQK